MTAFRSTRINHDDEALSISRNKNMPLFFCFYTESGSRGAGFCVQVGRCWAPMLAAMTYFLFLFSIFYFLFFIFYFDV
jgi:hypothetical protein